MSDTQTVWEALLEQLRLQGRYNSQMEVAPAVILWPDKNREWTELLPILRESLPQLLTLGDHSPEAKSGPAIWLRCMIAGTLPEAEWPEGTVPIIYLPGVSRQDLRAVEDCPRHLQPLAELQYRGVFFSQLSARDWTVLAFLVSEDGGLGLDVARDNATVEAIARALPILARTPVSALQSRHLEAADFDELINPDETRSLLVWLNDPQGAQAAWADNQWDAFCSRCTEKYGFDPESDGQLVAGEYLGRHDDNWSAVWQRYAEAPKLYPSIPDLLRQVRPNVPDHGLFFDRSAWPDENEKMENELREALTALGNASPVEVRRTIVALAGQHVQRREWVWARLGEAPLAQALEHMEYVAESTHTPIGGSTPEDVAECYVSGMWRVDAAALDALAVVGHPDDIAAVRTALEGAYVPWLTDTALHFQQVSQQHGLGGEDEGEEKPPDGVCILFADGLRYDVGQKLKAALDGAGLETEIDWEFAAIPTVTATAKPAASPIASLVRGDDAGADFTPVLAADGKSLDARRFRACLGEHGYLVLTGDETGTPDGAAWSEIGALDKHGHDEGWKLARRIDEEVRAIVMRVQALVAVGWREVRIITDHGWLLVPGELPKLNLADHLTETRWGRCAALKPTTKTDKPTMAWRWNADIRVAIAAGIGSFYAGKQYAHGGVSVQECVVPTLLVTSGESPVPAAIESLKWTGLRCRVEVSGGEGLSVDLRTKVGDSGTSVALEPKPVGDDKTASLIVPDDTLDGTAVNVVVLAENGQPVTVKPTTVGGEGYAD